MIDRLRRSTATLLLTLTCLICVPTRAQTATDEAPPTRVYALDLYTGRLREVGR